MEPDIEEALREAKEVLGRIFKVLKLDCQIADDTEMGGIVINDSTGGWQSDGFAGMSAEVVPGREGVFG